MRTTLVEQHCRLIDAAKSAGDLTGRCLHPIGCTALVVNDQTQQIVVQLELQLDAISVALAPMRVAFDRLIGDAPNDGEGWKQGGAVP